MQMESSILYRIYSIHNCDRVLMNFREIISKILTSNSDIKKNMCINHRYFMTLVQQSGDLELINLLQGPSNFNMYGPQNVFNITILIPQQMSIQQLGNTQELSMVKISLFFAKHLNCFFFRT